MTTGEKLAKLRRENNHTQEQLAQLLGVSRQSVSKWESDSAFPETEKLIRISSIYNCSLDYLLKDSTQTDNSPAPSCHRNRRDISLYFEKYERRSSHIIHGVPLWHVCFDFKKTATGIVAIGYRAKGVLSVGLLSMGLFSFGIVSLGVLSAGILALGLLALGCISAGILAVGAVCFGIFACGALAVGEFAVGALAIGHYAAKGDHALADIALGVTQAQGHTAQYLGEYPQEDMVRLLDTAVPWYLGWARDLFKLFL